MLISFIIPLYNCELYIGRCLNSIYNQGLKDCDFEVIVVNDGSTDNGGNEVLRFCDEHYNLVLLEQSNQGPGIARNKGLEIAKGKYIVFIDADDELVPYSISLLINKINSIEGGWDRDMIIYSCQNVNDGEPYRNFEIRAYEEYYSGSLLEYFNKFNIIPSVWLRLYRKNFIRNFKFSDIKYAEDTEFTLKLFSSPNSEILYFNLPIYIYRLRKGSLIHNYSKKYLRTVIFSYININRTFQKLDYLKKYKKEAIKTFYLNHVQTAAFLKLLSGNFSINEIRDYLKVFKKEGLLPFSYTPNKVVKFLSLISKSVLCSWLFSFPFRHIYLRFIK